MKKYIVFLTVLCVSCCVLAQEKAMRIQFANGKTELFKTSEISQITFENFTTDPYAPEVPDDPQPPTNGYIAQKMVEGRTFVR